MTPGDLLRGLGFLALTLVPMTAAHLVKQPTAAELIDGVVTSLVLTVVFVAGGVLGRNLSGRPGRICRSTPIQIGLGAAAAIVLQILVWGFWLAVFQEPRGAGERTAWYVHIALAALLGALACWLASRSRSNREPR